MGIVIREASISSIFNYLGVLIGFANVTLLMNNWFTPDQFGLRSILLDLAVIYSQIAHLGTYRSLVRFFPFFNYNNSDNSDNGLLTIGFLLSLTGFILIGLILFVFKGNIIDYYREDNPMIYDYLLLVIPLAFLLLYNNVLESYLQARSKTIFASFLKGVLSRLFVTILLIFYYLEWISFFGFIIFFIFSYCINILVLLIYLKVNEYLYLRINFKIFKSKIRKIYLNYSLFSILSGVSTLLINKVDSVMIFMLLGLTDTAIYSNAVYISVLVSIPSAAIAKISLPLISSFWRKKAIAKIDMIYKKTALHQFLIGGSLLILLWCSIDNFYDLQKEVYRQGKYVLLFLGLARIVNMMMGANGQIINTTKYYRFDTTSSILLAIITAASNYIAIPIWGIEGAAFATLSSIILFNLIRYIFVYAKLGMQPFTNKTLLCVIVLLAGLFVGTYLPYWNNIYIDTIYRSFSIMITIVILVLTLKVSEDLQNVFNKFLKRARTTFTTF